MECIRGCSNIVEWISSVFPGDEANAYNNGMNSVLQRRNGPHEEYSSLSVVISNNGLILKALQLGAL